MVAAGHGQGPGAAAGGQDHGVGGEHGAVVEDHAGAGGAVVVELEALGAAGHERDAVLGEPGRRGEEQAVGVRVPGEELLGQRRTVVGQALRIHEGELTGVAAPAQLAHRGEPGHPAAHHEDGARASGVGHASSCTVSQRSPSRTSTAWVPTGFVAGRVRASPVRRSKLAPWSGHSTQAPSMNPSDRA